MAPKKKTEKMSLGTFLQDENYGSWADEMEDMPLPTTDSRPGYGGERRGYGSATGGGMGMGFSDRRDYAPREQLPLPTEPPFTAHLANLSFDATEDEIKSFFQNCEVTRVRIVEDKLQGKPKGFGYVEFGTLDGLKYALNLSGDSLGGRMVRVSVAEPSKDRQESSRDLSDWSRKGPLPDLAGPQRRVSDRAGGFNRNFDERSDAGSERGGRRGFEPSGDGKSRDFSNWERKGPLSPAAPTSLREGGRQRSNNGPDYRKNSPSWGEGRSQDGSRPPRREYTEKPAIERAPTASEMDNEWRARMKPDAPAKSPTPETSNPPSPRPAALPASRPKLNLQKRTVSEADPASSPSAADSKASPFGAARPVDTATKERAIEEKRLQVLREKKEEEEKAKQERAEEKRLKEKEKADGVKSEATSPKLTKQPSRGETGEEESTPAGPKFDILRRADSNTNDMLAEDDQDEEVNPTTDKAVKPKEVVVPASQANGSWRRGPKSPAAATPTSATTAEVLEEDGWSTVSKPNKQRNNRRGGGNAPSRAMAS